MPPKNHTKETLYPLLHMGTRIRKFAPAGTDRVGTGTQTYIPAKPFKIQRMPGPGEKSVTWKETLLKLITKATENPITLANQKQTIMIVYLL